MSPAVNLRRRASPTVPYNRASNQVNGFYVHSSPPKGHYRLMPDLGDITTLYVHTCPPRVVQMNPSTIRQWLRGGEIDQLEQVILEGQGHKLIGEYSPDPKVRNFLKGIPAYLARIGDLHDAVNKGNLTRLKSLIPTDDSTMKNIALSKDLSGAGLLHKAVYNDHGDIARWLIERFPETVKLKDRDGKTALHYCGASRDREALWHALVKAGADPNLVDSRGRTAAYYMERPGAIELPEPKPPSGSLKRFTSGKEGLVVKPSNIRIWIHDRDLGRLQQVLWEGYGNKLRTETSNNPRVKRFLDAIPYAMNAIKDVHGAIVNDDHDEFAKKTADPVPTQILASKDANGLNPLHKASGLGRLSMVEDILEKNPRLVHSVDHDGRTPLHYAAWARNNDAIYNFLVENGADEMAFDNNGKLPSYYRSNPKEPLAKFLTVIPEAPRTSVSFPPAWDWSLLGQTLTRSTINIPQLVGGPAKVDSERRSVSDYDMTLNMSLRPPDEDEARVMRIVDQVKEKVVKVEEKIFQDDPMKPVEKVTKMEEFPGVNEPSEMVEKEQDEEDAKAMQTDEEVSLAGAEPEERVDEAEKTPEKAEIPEKAITPETERVEEFELETKFEAEMENENPAQEYVEDRAINLWSREEEPDTETDEVGENAAEESSPAEEEAGPDETPADGEPSDEKSEREIAEERQRMMDEGLIKVEEDDDDEDEADAQVNEIIRRGDMQGLASLVLDGEGERLLGKKSVNAEIQGFLDNVPSYIAKIKAVHKAARAGELRDLQAALDRRRFAVAKDGSNSVGVTPLHVAVLFGRTPIVKYLGGRFPETLNTPDKKGRTSLHYAACLADNGHYFNILLNLGADRKLKDNAGNPPGYYLENRGELTQEMLLHEFNAPAQLAKEMLSNKALGEPLIKGLTQIANKRPDDPITFLANYLHDFIDTHQGVSTPITDPSLRNGESEARQNEGPSASRHIGKSAGPGGDGNDGGTDNNAGADSVDDEQESVNANDTGQRAFVEANRDEYGQTVLHFAAARAHGRSGLFQLIQESGINLAYRDELYRTARDVALQANIADNINEIDKFVLGLAARGETDKLSELLLEGYDHILDLEDDEDCSIIDVVAKKNQTETLEFLRSIPSFEEKRERIHRAIRAGDSKLVADMIAEPYSGKKLLTGKSTTSRCSLHIAVLCQQEDMTELIAQKYPETLRVGDNLERTALHYAMGVDKVESLSNILIRCGARRVAKDLKGRQPTYYFMNKSDILRLQEEEELLRM